MRVVLFTSSARFDMFEAADWYENEANGLGERFLLDVDATGVRITDNPLQFPIAHKNIRRALLANFPYVLMYVIETDETVSVISCFHCSRNPLRWQNLI